MDRGKMGHQLTVRYSKGNVLLFERREEALGPAYVILEMEIS